MKSQDLMQCRNALLAATHANGLVLNGWSPSSNAMQSVTDAFNAELLELRYALRRANELLQQRCDLLHLNRLGLIWKWSQKYQKYIKNILN